MTSPTAASRHAHPDIRLPVAGMTCASCAARIEKKLNRMDGVVATVNYSTEKAKVTAPEGVKLGTIPAHANVNGSTED